MKLNVPFYSQIKNIENPSWQLEGCGVTSLKMVLDFYKPIKESVDELFKLGVDLNGYSKEDGWYHHSLVQIARKFGLKGITRNWSIHQDFLTSLRNRRFTKEEIQILEKQLLEEGILGIINQLKQKHPVMASVKSGFSPNGSGHLVVLIGLNKNGFILHDPFDQTKKGQAIEIDFETFKQSWSKRAIVILPN